MLSCHHRLVGTLAALLITLVPLPLLSDSTKDLKFPPTQLPVFDQVERLTGEQKYQEALTQLEDTIKANKATGLEQARLLVKRTQLQLGLHGYETALKSLRTTAWPVGSEAQALLQIYYVHALRQYVGQYAYEIRTRETVDTGGDLDLKQWSLERIAREIEMQLWELWKGRKQWGNSPLGTAGEFITRNSFPESVRSTWYDFVTYQWVEFLRDSGFWTPAQGNEVYRINLATELKANRSDFAQFEGWLKMHPLERANRLLSDLESWHHEQKREEAALEARLQRVLLLLSQFNEAGSRRTRVMKVLRQVAESAPQVPWKAKAFYDYARARSQETDPEALVEAIEWAERGQKVAPQSPGAEMCRHLAAEIRDPSYQLQSMLSDASERPSIKIEYKNLKKLYLRAYRVDLEKMATAEKDYNFFPNSQQILDLMKSQKPTVQWEVDLQPTKDYREHRRLVVPPLKAKGYYLIVASSLPSFEEQTNNRVSGVHFIQTHLTLATERTRDGSWWVRSFDGRSGERLGNVELRLYRFDWRTGHRLESTISTNKDGEARVKGSESSGSYYLFAQKGEDVAVIPNGMSFYSVGKEGEQEVHMLYTDRSIYRPNQVVMWKVVSFHGPPNQGQYKPFANTEMEVILRDANYKEVKKQKIRTNEYGTASGSFEIPAGRLLGVWNLLAQRTPSRVGQTSLRVEEYKRPTFEVTVGQSEKPMRVNTLAVVMGSVKYYHGLPVTAGKFRWTVSRQKIYPWWWGWYYWGQSTAGQNQIIAAGEGSLSATGDLKIPFVPEADPEEEKKQMSYSYLVNVDVTDEGGETRSGAKSFQVGFVAVQAQVSREVNFFDSKVRAQFQVSLSTLDGNPQAGVGRYRIVGLNQPKSVNMPAEIPRPIPERHRYLHDDDFRNARWETTYNWQQVLFQWKSGAMVQSGKVNHGKDGKGAIQLNPLPPGPYRIEYETHDRFGKEAKTTHDFLVVGKGLELQLPLVVVAEKSSYKVGETARMLVYSGMPQQALEFQMGHGADKTLREIRRIAKQGIFFDFKVTPEWRGGFFIDAKVIRDFQRVTIPLNIHVPWDNKELKVEFERIRQKMEPGAREKWSIKVGAPSGSGGLQAGELLAYMYDRSLEAFAPHFPGSPLDHYPTKSYNGYPDEVHLHMAPGFSLLGYGWYSGGGPSFHGDFLKSFANYGIGGLGMRGGNDVMSSAGAPMEMDDRAEVAAYEADASVPASAPVSAKAARLAKSEESAPAKEAAFGVVGAGALNSAGLQPPAPAPVRSNFSETAFWQPHLKWNGQGQVSVEFQVPDSVTSWRVWAHALSSSVQSGKAQADVQTVKDLMVRPYMPRFVREGDRAALKIVVQNAGKAPLTVELTGTIENPETGKSVLSQFGHKGEVWSQTVKVPAQGSANATLNLVVPPQLGMVKVTIKGKAGQMTDGEERPLPILPSRMHLLQSRFAALRKGKVRELKFPDMAKGDDSSLINKQLVMTVDAQLLYSVLSAVPYLVNFPYECIEQTLNRFVSTAILTQVFGTHPLVKEMAAKFAKSRSTQFEKWRADDPNRLLMLEESPWMADAEGGSRQQDELIKVLDPKVALQQRESSLRKLKEAQTANGSFPWYPGGAPSPYMTLLVVHGFSKITELGGSLPKDMVVKAWGYLGQHLRTTKWEDLGVEFLVFLNYVASSYPDASWTGNFFSEGERQKILEYTFAHWKKVAPLTKAQLALTLQRHKRAADAKLLMDSIMDSSKTNEDEGTFWIAEDRAWLWYNDTIEGHAYALRALTELNPQDPRRDGLVQWLFLNKKLSHWKSTRATAEVLYALTYYLKQEKLIGVEERVKLKVGKETQEYTFKPNEYTGKSKQWVIPGHLIKPKEMSVVQAEKTDSNLGFVSATWHFSTEKLPTQGDGDFLQVARSYYVRSTKDQKMVLTPLTAGTKVKVGDEIEVQLSLRSKQAMEYVHLRDPRAAGLEPGIAVSKWAWDLGLARYEEIRDSATHFFIEWLPAGEYTLKYRVKANMAGVFRVGPAVIQAMYAPEFGAYSAGHLIEVQ